MTNVQVAQAYGVDKTAISLAKFVRANGIPAVVQAVEDGSISLYAARCIIRAGGDQAITLARIKDAPRINGRFAPGAVNPLLRARRPRLRPAQSVLMRFVVTLNHTVAALVDHAAGIDLQAFDEEVRGQLDRELTKTIREARRLRRRLRREEKEDVQQ